MLKRLWTVTGFGDDVKLTIVAQHIKEIEILRNGTILENQILN